MSPVDPIPSMVQPSAWTTALFVAIVLGLYVLLVRAAARAGRRWAVGTAVGAALWLAVTGAAAASGVLERQTFPPPVMIVMLASLLVAAGAALSPLGTRLVASAPLAALVGFQAFRLPLEMVLHQWWKQGVLPVQMTFAGHNFDIVTGVLALALGLWGWRRPLPRGVVIAFNVIGTALLATVATIAVLSTPIPLRKYLNDPPVLLAYHFPYVWIVPACVGGALFGHVLLFRRLFGRAAPA
jgi:hypothetical protein